MRAINLAVVGCALTAAAACGRFGFDLASSEIDASGDGVPPLGVCQATQVTIDLGASANRVLATTTAQGYAVAVMRPPVSAMLGVQLDSALQPTATQLAQTTPAIGASLSYVGGSIAWDGANVIGEVNENNPNMYLKVLRTDMSGFTNAVAQNGRCAVPAFARAGAAPRMFWFDGTSIGSYGLLATGVPEGVPVVNTTALTAINNLTVASSRVAIAVADSGGECHLFTISAAGARAKIGAWLNCSEPYAVGRGNQVDVIYGAGSASELRTIDLTVDPAAISEPLPIGDGGRPRILHDTTTQLAVREASDGLHIASITGNVVEQLTVSGAPAGRPDGWEVVSALDTTRGRIFAAYGNQLWAITCN